MRLRITRIGSDPTVIFALDELSKYLRQMDPTIRVEEFLCATYEEYILEPAHSVLIGVGHGVEEAFDDKIHIGVEKAKA